jgi:L-seryl-tRNA(Ser) seleniumtransferase
MTLAVLEATLRLFLDEQKALQQIPTLKMMLRPVENLQNQADAIAETLRKAKLQCEVSVLDGFSQTGSGSLPGQNLPTRLVAISGTEMSSVVLGNRLRHYCVPIFTRIQDNKILIDPRTLLDGDQDIIIEALTKILGS